MEVKIENMNDLRGAVTILTDSVNKMCNDKDMEDVSVHFIQAKDYLVSIFKYNVERLQK